MVRSRKRLTLVESAVKHTRRSDPSRLVDATQREDGRRLLCDYIPCTQPFTPARKHQRFCKDVHRVYAWQHPEQDRGANKREPGTKRRA